jgi:ribokinase
MNNVFIVGSMNIDLIFSTKRIPEAGETLHGDDFSMLAGGKGANQAVACALLGASSYMIGNVGDDLFGDMILENLKKHSVNTEYVSSIKNKTSGVACIILNDGDNRIILDQGANENTLYSQVKKTLGKLGKENDVLLAQLEIPVETVLKTFELAKKMGMKTLLNPAPAQKLPDEIYKFVDVIVPNEIEAEMITGISSHSDNFSRYVVQYFINKGVKEVIITRGCKGSVYGDDNGLIEIRPFKVKVVDTTGAGDAFVGALAAQMSKGFNAKQSLDYATAGSALSVTKFGAQNSMPSLEAVEELLRRKQG